MKLSLGVACFVAFVVACGGKIDEPDQAPAVAAPPEDDAPVAESCVAAARICADEDAGEAWACHPRPLERCASVADAHGTRALCCS